MPGLRRVRYGAAVNLEIAARSDTGRVRPHNEDSLLVRPGKRLFAVADGMGGHVAGEIASALAVETLDARIGADESDTTILAERLATAILEANTRILARGQEDPNTRGMGTTLTALAFAPGYGACAIGHVGDSRAYRFRGGRLELLTHDHTWVQEQVDAGHLLPEEARRHPFANVLSRVLGLPDLDAVEVGSIQVREGDVLLLCSDGLTTMVDEDAIVEILEAEPSLEAAANQLVDAANAHGGVDNITVIVLRAMQGRS